MKKINLVIPKKSIPHFLEIDTSYLDSTKIFGYTNSFELLNAFFYFLRIF